MKYQTSLCVEFRETIFFSCRGVIAIAAFKI